MSVAKALERFSFESWKAMTQAEGIKDKIYSPYSAFVAMLLTTLLSRETTKQELLRCLQFEDANADSNVLAAELAQYLLECEYCPDFYDPAFEQVLEGVKEVFNSKGEPLPPSKKSQLMAFAVREFGSVSETIRIVEGAKQEKQQPEFKLWDDKNENVKKLRPLSQKLNELQHTDRTIVGANRLWPNAKMNLDMNEFAILTEKMKMEVTPVEFPQPGVDQINEAIAKITNNLIQKLLSPDCAPPDTSCILTNAIYFNAKWRSEFKTDKVPVDWTMLDGSVKKVGLMPQDGSFKVHKASGATFVSIPYRGCDYAMIIALPDERGEAAFKAVLDAVNPALLEEASQATETFIALKVPKFTSRWGSASLKAMLVTLGAHEIFSRNAKFVAKSFVSDVVQQAVIKVHESGTEAAAATAIMMRCMCMPMTPSVEVTCDHPFLYFIRNTVNGSILFMGACLDPKEEE